MTTDLDTYRQHLVAALRQRDVAPARIGEAVAEVESHVADTGEDPVTAFGEPAEYAGRLTQSLGRSGPRLSRWTNFIVAVVAFAASGVATTALLDGAPAPAVAALLVLAGLGGWLYWRREAHRIVDPRTGATLRLPAPRWTLVALVLFVVGLLVIAVVL